MSERDAESKGEKESPERMCNRRYLFLRSGVERGGMERIQSGHRAIKMLSFFRSPSMGIVRSRRCGRRSSFIIYIERLVLSALEAVNIEVRMNLVRS